VGRRTYSVCPVCLKRIPAERVDEDGGTFLHKACPEHGAFRTILWRGRTDLDAWIGNAEGAPLESPRCPEACGLCPDHLQGTCCVLLEVTKRCDLACRFCFADGGGGAEPAFGDLEAQLRQLAVPGKTLVQLSGGEPTTRADLPELVAAAKAVGCRYVQLNSNGLRLAEDAGYARALADAGLSFVFMQFDGTDDAIHARLRGRPLLAAKRRAIEHCAASNLGVTLVPTVVPGVNTHDLGGILRLAVSLAPAVRGVHFQPVSHLGRIPAPPTDELRFTLDELLAGLERQAEGLLPPGRLLPSHCDHPMCGFHGDFVVGPDGRLAPLSRPRGAGSEGCCGPATADQNRAFVARRWLRPLPVKLEEACCQDLRDLDYFSSRVQTHGFTVTAMAFQDAGNLDLERLRRCSLHVFDHGRFVPFCAYYLSGFPS